MPLRTMSVVVLALAGPVHADVTFHLGTLAVGDASNQVDVDLEALTIPSDIYVSATVSFDWTNVASAFSSEARWVIANAPSTSFPTINYAQALSAGPGSAASGAPASIGPWTVNFSQPYESGPLWFSGFQDFLGSSATWSSVTVTLNSLPRPAAADLGAIANETETFAIDVTGSDFDTEIALYDFDGNLLDENDDVNPPTDRTSRIDSVQLAPGKYFVAVGGFNTIFFNTLFNVTPGSASGNVAGDANGAPISGSVASGQVTWFCFTVVPAPCPGDINGDQMVTLEDFTILAANFGGGPGLTLGDGDLTGDGFVNLADFTELAANFGADCTMP
jgi:hypothetical protein